VATVRFNHLHSSLVEASLSGDTCNARRASWILNLALRQYLLKPWTIPIERNRVL